MQLRRTLTVVAATAALSVPMIAPALAQFTQVVGTSRCHVTATGPTFVITTLPKPSVTPDGAVGASVYCPV